jgi:hypothetical protein
MIGKTIALLGLFGLIFVGVYSIYLILGCEDKLIYFLLYFCKTRENKRFAPCLTFPQFLSFYNLNPKKWLLYYESAYYIASGQEFHFTTYGEVYKYKKWFNRVAKEQAKRNALRDLNVAMSDLIRNIRAEIEKNNAETEAKTKQLMENLNIK